MARGKKDEQAPEETPEEQQAADSGDAGETAPGEPGDVIDARLQMQEQGDDAVASDDEDAAPGVSDELDKDEEAEAQHANVVGGARGLANGPTQDELNPAYSAPAKQE